MTSFRDYLESEEKDNVRAMIAKLPKRHQKLLKGFKFKYEGGNTLKGDDQHIGVIYQDKITVAAPWKYSREFTTLHEIAHLVYEHLMTPALKKEWAGLVKKNKPGQMKKIKNKGKSPAAVDQNAEEIFCMIYAQLYADTGVLKFENPEWLAFVKNKVPR